jgi:hypothetical protein
MLLLGRSACQGMKLPIGHLTSVVQNVNPPDHTVATEYKLSSIN